MRESKHTPGPWYLMDDGDVVTEYTNHNNLNVVVAFAPHEPEVAEGINWRANARLIAAAPELLEAAQMALAFYGEDDNELIDHLRAAIAKATEGGS